jgi:hypothetical protein
LNLARGGEGTRDLPKPRIPARPSPKSRSPWSSKVGTIEDIEKLCPKLQRGSLGQGCLFDQ